MATHNILVKNSVDNKNKALIRPAKASADIDNGNVFYLSTGYSAVAGEGEVFLATQPATGSGLKLSLKLLETTYISIADGSIGNQRTTAYKFEVVDNSTGLWMAYEPEVVVTVSGTKKYKGIDVDVRDFYTPSGEVFTAFKPQVGDILTFTADGITGSKSTNTYAVAANGQYALAWAASANS